MRVANPIHLAIVLASLLSSQAGAGELRDAGFKKTVAPFLEKYCLDCHDEETKKGSVSLESLSDVSADNASLWKRIWEQVALKEMPPRKKTNQPQ